jgi:hypothetical protein
MPTAMSDSHSKSDELGALLRDHSGLEGLARELCQHDPNLRRYEPAANDNAPRARRAVAVAGLLAWWRAALVAVNR